MDLNEGEEGVARLSNGTTNRSINDHGAREPLGMARVKDVLGTHVALSGWSGEPTDPNAIIGNTGFGTIYGAPPSDSAMDFDQPEPPTPVVGSHGEATSANPISGAAANVPPPLPLDRNTRGINSSSGRVQVVVIPVPW